MKKEVFWILLHFFDSDVAKIRSRRDLLQLFQWSPVSVVMLKQTIVKREGNQSRSGSPAPSKASQTDAKIGAGAASEVNLD